MTRLLVHACLYIAYLLVAVLLILYLAFWMPWAKSIENTAIPDEPDLPVIQHVKPTTLQKVGTLMTDKESSFIHFGFDKPEGAIRVCGIGDSFVHGAEVGPALDYPTLLGKLFQQHGYPNVEVINYGNSWHGFHQAFILWEDLAKPMGCDFVLTGPSTFHHYRDTTFNHTSDTQPYYLHSIYVLDETRNDLIRIDVRGEDYQERMHDYYRFIPRWSQVRNDYQPAPLLRALLPDNKTIQNPFYPFNFTTDTEKTWELLLGKIAADSTQTIALSIYPQITSTGTHLGMDNYATAEADLTNIFPARAPTKHMSGTGNAQVAHMFFNLLTGQGDADYPAVHVADVAGHNDGPAIDWAHANAITIVSDGQTIGSFLYIDHRMHQPWSLPSNEPVYLLNLRGTGQGLLDGVFLQLDASALQKKSLSLTDDRGHQVALGAPGERVTNLNLYEKTIPGFLLGYWDDLSLDLDTLEQHTGTRLEGTITLQLDDTALLQGQSQEGQALVTLTATTNTGLLRAVSNGESLLDWQQAPETIYLEVQTSTGTERFAIGQTAMISLGKPPIQGNIGKIICKATADAPAHITATGDCASAASGH